MGLPPAESTVEVYLFLAIFFCSGSGSLARVTPCSLANLRLRAVYYLRYESAMELWASFRLKDLQIVFAGEEQFSLVQVAQTRQ